MTREDLIALHAALGGLLSLPDSVRELIVQWLTPEAARKAGNGHDPHPPPFAPTPYQGKRKRGRPKTLGSKSPGAAERKLIAAMADNPGLSVVALANAAGSSRSATGERLRQMALQGIVEKSVTGRWKLNSEEPRPPDPPQPSLS
jgi:hypothetical protein